MEHWAAWACLYHEQLVQQRHDGAPLSTLQVAVLSTASDWPLDEMKAMVPAQEG